MASFRKPNMSSFNSAMRKLNSANNQFKRDANKAIRELKSLERQTKSYQSKLRSMSAPSISTIPSLYLGNASYDELNAPPTYVEEEKDYDVFISHASEDKENVARPLAEALRSNGLNVWYDEFELKIGDSLRRKIDKGIANSNFGVIVISRDFISKGWTNYELDGLITRAVNGEQVMLPIWHNITKREVLNYSPSLADKLARIRDEFVELKRKFPNSIFMETAQYNLSNVKVDMIVYLIPSMSHALFYKVQNTNSLNDVRRIYCNNRSVNNVLLNIYTALMDE